jgi:ribosomal protein S27E
MSWYCPDCDVIRGEEGQRWYGRAATVPVCGACGTTMQLVVVDPDEDE